MQIAKWGNSLAVRIPADVVRTLGLKEGDEVHLRAGKDGALDLVTETMRREAAIRDLRKLRGMMPPDFKFDRDEANARGRIDAPRLSRQ